jgi:hypothetical protein
VAVAGGHDRCLLYRWRWHPPILVAIMTAMTASIRVSVCLAVLGLLLLVAGTAKGLSGASAQGPGDCPARFANSPPIASTNPCVRASSGGWNQAGWALLAPGVLALIGAGPIRITARR